jgi:hypothetical protein
MPCQEMMVPVKDFFKYSCSCMSAKRGRSQRRVAQKCRQCHNLQGGVPPTPFQNYKKNSESCGIH